MLVVVKLQDVAGLLDEVGPAVASGATVVSLAAGVRIATLEQRLADGVAVVRAMPNTPALVGQGCSGSPPARTATRRD